MSASKPHASPTVVEGLTRPVETNLQQLINEYDLQDEDLLVASSKIAEILGAWGLCAIPPIGTKGLGDVRVLVRRDVQAPTSIALQEIEAGEGPAVEFKQTLYLDVDKHEKGGQPIKSCPSKEVLLSSLKTIAAYMNTAGGTLLIGVRDNGTPTCISREYELVTPKAQDFDHWELFLRGKIDSMFVNGRAASASVTVQKLDFDGSVGARVQVGARSSLTILNDGDGEKLFVRAGNRTLSVAPSELEQFYNLQAKFV